MQLLCRRSTWREVSYGQGPADGPSQNSEPGVQPSFQPDDHAVATTGDEVNFNI